MPPTQIMKWTQCHAPDGKRGFGVQVMHTADRHCWVKSERPHFVGSLGFRRANFFFSLFCFQSSFAVQQSSSLAMPPLEKNDPHGKRYESLFFEDEDSEEDDEDPQDRQARIAVYVEMLNALTELLDEIARLLEAMENRLRKNAEDPKA
uniref:Uncharacterized protein n=1 Tax=Panagrellus redivivus TaxID=6233 RepID=A0A7E4VBZ1_PANRE